MMATKNIRGLLVTNAFLKNGKFVEHYEWLREAARQQEIRLDLCVGLHLEEGRPAEVLLKNVKIMKKPKLNMIT